MLFCIKCGYKMPDGANFCPKCGAAKYAGSPTAEVKPDKETVKEIVKDGKFTLEHTVEKGGVTTTEHYEGEKAKTFLAEYKARKGIK